MSKIIEPGTIVVNNRLSTFLGDKITGYVIKYIESMKSYLVLTVNTMCLSEKIYLWFEDEVGILESKNFPYTRRYQFLSFVRFKEQFPDIDSVYYSPYKSIDRYKRFVLNKIHAVTLFFQDFDRYEKNIKKHLKELNFQQGDTVCLKNLVNGKEVTGLLFSNYCEDEDGNLTDFYFDEWAYLIWVKDGKVVWSFVDLLEVKKVDSTPETLLSQINYSNFRKMINNNNYFFLQTKEYIDSYEALDKNDIFFFVKPDSNYFTKDLF